MIRRLLLSIGLLIALGSPARAQLVGDMADAMVALSAPRVEQAGKQAQVTLASERVAEAFNGVVVQGFSSATEFEGWIRFDEVDGWSPWHALYVVRSATDGGFMAAYRGKIFRKNQRFELRFTLDGADDFDLLGAGVFDNRNDADRRRGAAVSIPDGAAKGASVIVPPVLIPRAAWGAESFRGTPIALNRPDYVNITFHHTAGFGATTLEEGLQQVKNIQDFHQNGRGWSDIGYQFVMDRSGRLYQGRPFLNNSVSFEQGPPLAQGAHVGGHNTGNIGVSVLGCYHPPEGTSCQDQMTPAALDSLQTMFAYLVERYGVQPENIMGHRDFSATACPGDNNYPMLPTIRASVAELLRTGNRPLGTASLAAVADEAGVVRLEWAFLDDFGITSYRIERVVDDIATVIFEGEGAVPEVFSDAQVSQAGEVTYRLTARNAAGREQILATAQATVEAPASFVLAHNFPNPFTGTTTIRYFLERAGIVRLKVFDVMGRELATLDDEYRDGGLWYTATFDGRGLAGGTYFYRIQVEGFAGIDYDKTRSVVLVK